MIAYNPYLPAPQIFSAATALSFVITTSDGSTEHTFNELSEAKKFLCDLEQLQEKTALVAFSNIALVVQFIVVHSGRNGNNSLSSKAVMWITHGPYTEETMKGIVSIPQNQGSREYLSKLNGVIPRALTCPPTVISSHSCEKIELVYIRANCGDHTFTNMGSARAYLRQTIDNSSLDQKVARLCFCQSVLSDRTSTKMRLDMKTFDQINLSAVQAFYLLSEDFLKDSSLQEEPQSV